MSNLTEVPMKGKYLVQEVTGRIYHYTLALAGRKDMKLYEDGERKVNMRAGYNSSHPEHRPQDDDRNKLLDGNLSNLATTEAMAKMQERLDDLASVNQVLIKQIAENQPPSMPPPPILKS